MSKPQTLEVLKFATEVFSCVIDPRIVELQKSIELILEAMPKRRRKAALPIRPLLYSSGARSERSPPAAVSWPTRSSGMFRVRFIFPTSV